MRSIFFILSDDNIGSTPRFAPGSQAQPITIDDAMETSNNDQVDVVSAVSASSGLSSQLKRKAGDLFSGSSILKQRNLSLS